MFQSSCERIQAIFPSLYQKRSKGVVFQKNKKERNGEASRGSWGRSVAGNRKNNKQKTVPSPEERKRT